MNETYIYENYDDETLNNILFEIKNYTLKEDIFSPFMEKETLLYNNPALKKISQYAIKTDVFNLIDADYFQHLSTLSDNLEKEIKETEQFENEQLQEILDDVEDGEKIYCDFTKRDQFRKKIKQCIINLPNINFFNNLSNNNRGSNILDSFKIKNPVVSLSDKEFLEILKINNIASYAIIKKEINNINNHDYEGIASFNLKDKKFLIDFKQKTLPEFIKLFNKLISSNEKDEALHFAEFFSSSVGQEASKLTNLGFSIFAHSLFSHNFNMSFAKIITKQIYESEHIGELKRKILINEASQCSNLPLTIIRNLTIKNKPVHKKNNKF